MSTTEQQIAKAKEQQVVFVPLVMPMVVYQFINDAAAKRGKSPGAIINEVLFEKLKAMAEEDLPKEGG